jgi:glucose/arabinose dehydrogenase
MTITKNHRLISLFVILFLFFYITSCHAAGTVRGIQLDRIQLPPGFKIRLYAVAVPNARSLAMSPQGVLFVGTRLAGKIYAVLETDQDHIANEVITIAEGLNRPNGVAFRNGALYVADVNRILRYENIEESLRNPPDPVVVNDTFPKDQHHGWKYIPA